MLNVARQLGALSLENLNDREHRLQQIIEIVCDTSCQRTDGFDLLRVAELVSQSDFRRDIALDCHKLGDRPVVIAHRRDRGLFFIKAAVFAAVDEVAVPDRSCRDDAPERFVERSVLLAAFQQPRGLPERVVTGVSGNPFERGIHILDHAHRVGDDDQFGCLLDDGGQPALGFFRLAASGDLLLEVAIGTFERVRCGDCVLHHVQSGQSRRAHFLNLARQRSGPLPDTILHLLVGAAQSGFPGAMLRHIGHHNRNDRVRADPVRNELQDSHVSVCGITDFFGIATCPHRCQECGEAGSHLGIAYRVDSLTDDRVQRHVQELSETAVAKQNETICCHRQGALVHHFDEEPVRLLGAGQHVHEIALGSGNHYAVDIAASNRAQSLLGLFEPHAQIFDFASGGGGRADGIHDSSGHRVRQEILPFALAAMPSLHGDRAR